MSQLLRRLRLDTPVGAARALIDDDDATCALGFEDGFAELERRVTARSDARVVEGDASTTTLARALEAYFAGDLGALAAVAARPRGTAFEERVWTALRDIGPGETRAYGELAASLGAPSAARAVGAANGKNPVSLIIPCHRVVGARGELTGYAWGVARKRWLLEHEAGARGMIRPCIAHEWRKRQPHRI
ncbi:MAG TPA: methylated-DNA--[protein]-cysteine S-methyltransferase [Byssovorax sp.]